MRGASVAPVALTETDLELLEKRVNRSWPKNPAKFAWVVGRNFAIDKRRSLDRAARREQEAMLAAEEDRIKREKREAAVKEFAGLIVDLATLGRRGSDRRGLRRAFSGFDQTTALPVEEPRN